MPFLDAVAAPDSVIPVHFKSAADPALVSTNYVAAGKMWWDTGTNYIKIRNDANTGWDILYQVGATAAQSNQQNGLVSGGQVVKKTGLTFTISAATYYINNQVYNSPETDITLDAADMTNPRIDLIVVTTSNTAIKVTGTPAATPAKPDYDPETQLEVTFILVPAGATDPADVVVTDVYQENAEWTGTPSDASFVLNSTADPFAGALSIEATGADVGDLITFAAPSPLDINLQSLLSLRVKSKAAWAVNKYVRFYFRNAGGSRVGNFVLLRPTGTYGFNSATTGAYQQVAIPISDFAIPVGTQISSLRMEVRGSGAAIGFFADAIILQAGVPQGSTNTMKWRGTWNSATSYITNDVVIKTGIPYIAIQPSTNKDPVSQTAYWTALTATDNDTRLDALEAADVSLDSRLDAEEAASVSFDSRLDALESHVITITELPNDARDVSWPIVIGSLDGAAQVAGAKLQGVRIPWTGDIIEWTLTSDQSCTATVDVKTATYANWPTTASIFGTKPALAAARKNEASGLTLQVTEGDLADIVLDANDNAKQLVLTFIIRRGA